MFPPFHLSPAPAYLVALSGGADSRLLLELTVRALLEREPEGDVKKRLLAVHIHHGIRGAEADRDEAFCRSLCDALGVPLVVEHADIPALAAQTGESLETVARRVRYACFLRLMQEHGIPCLLTAHHADDNLETVLDRLLRGSGIRGMGGIPPTRVLGGSPDGPLWVVRPLLEWSKADILAACDELGLTYVTDSSNLETDCTRNRLRHTVIPALEAVAGPGVPQRTVARLSRAAREDEEALAEIAYARYAAIRSPSGGLPAAEVARELPAVAKRILLYAYRDFLGGDPPADRTLSAHHLEGLCLLCREGRDGDVSDLLPHGVKASLRGGDLRFSLPPTEPSPLSPEPRPLYEGDTLWDPGSADTPAIVVRVETAAAPLAPCTGRDVCASAVFPAAPLPLPLYARPRRAGDTILSHGMTKRLKKLLCDTGVPPELRDRLPLILLPDAETPLWYPTVAFRDGFSPPETGTCLRITLFLSSRQTQGHL